VDEFVAFEFMLLDASHGPAQKVRVVEQVPRRERVDLIARHFHEFLTEGDPDDTSPHGMVMTHDFKVRRQVGKTAGWLTFLVDRGTVDQEELEEVALLVFARDDDQEGREIRRRLEPYINFAALPAAPMVVAVRLAVHAPPVVGEWYGKAVAGFFSADGRVE
jgi:hypothetical protein